MRRARARGSNVVARRARRRRGSALRADRSPLDPRCARNARSRTRSPARTLGEAASQAPHLARGRAPHRSRVRRARARRDAVRPAADVRVDHASKALTAHGRATARSTSSRTSPISRAARADPRGLRKPTPSELGARVPDRTSSIGRHWEIAMSLRGAPRPRRARPGGERLGVGAGSGGDDLLADEPRAPRLRHRPLRRQPAVGSRTRRGRCSPTPGPHASGPWEPQRLVVQHMDALELRYDDASFDGVFSSARSSTSGRDDVRRAARRDAPRAAPGWDRGALDRVPARRARSTSLPGTLLFDEHELRALFDDELWELVEPLELTVSEATMRVVIDIEEAVAAGTPADDPAERRFPHLVVQHKAGATWTSVLFVLRALKCPAATRLACLEPVRRRLPARRALPQPLPARAPRPLSRVDAGPRVDAHLPAHADDRVLAALRAPAEGGVRSRTTRCS